MDRDFFESLAILLKATLNRTSPPEIEVILQNVNIHLGPNLADISNRRVYETVVSIALHFSPVTAIAWDETDIEETRGETIAAYIKKTWSVSSELSQTLGELIWALLDRLETTRKSVSGMVDELGRDYGWTCQHCHITTESSFDRDPMKQYHDDTDPWFDLEVDHIDAVSRLGTNARENLHLLCTLCNRGKGDGHGIPASSTLRFAALRPSAYKQGFRLYKAQLVYYTLRRDKTQCVICETQTKPLTVRLVSQEGALIVSNLISTCYPCMKTPLPKRADKTNGDRTLKEQQDDQLTTL